MTIQEIQAAIDAKYDTRQIINLIADYLEDNPSGGSATTIYTGDGSLSGNRIVDLNGHTLTFDNAITGIYLDTLLALSCQVDGGGKYINIGELVGSGGTGIRVESTLSSKYIDLDTPLGVVDIGDVGTMGNSVHFAVSDASQSISGTAPEVRFFADAGPEIKLSTGGSPELLFKGLSVNIGDIGISQSLIEINSTNKTFIFSSESQNLIFADNANGISYLRSFGDNGDDGNEGLFSVTSTSTTVTTVVKANFNSGDKVASITALSNVALSSLEYTADTHTFNGELQVNNNTISTDNGTTKFNVTGVQGGTTSPDSLIAITINGVPYSIPAANES